MLSPSSEFINCYRKKPCGVIRAQVDYSLLQGASIRVSRSKSLSVKKLTDFGGYSINIKRLLYEAVVSVV